MRECLEYNTGPYFLHSKGPAKSRVRSVTGCSSGCCQKHVENTHTEGWPYPLPWGLLIIPLTLQAKETRGGESHPVAVGRGKPGFKGGRMFIFRPSQCQWSKHLSPFSFRGLTSPKPTWRNQVWDFGSHGGGCFFLISWRLEMQNAGQWAWDMDTDSGVGYRSQMDEQKVLDNWRLHPDGEVNITIIHMSNY